MIFLCLFMVKLLPFTITIFRWRKFYCCWLGFLSFHDRSLFSFWSWFCGDFSGEYLRYFFARKLIFRDDLSTTVKWFWDNIFISKTKVCRNIASSFPWIILFSPISAVEIVVSFEPLDELKVVLIFTFDKLLDVDISFDSCLIKGSLKNFHVADEFIIIFGSPVDFIHQHFSWVDNINYLTVHRTSSQLFYFGEV